MKKIFATVLAAALVSSSSATHAQTFCPAPPGASPELSKIDAATRLAFVRGVMADQAKRGRLWMTGWVVGGFALSAGNFVVAGLQSKEDRVDSITGGVTSLFIPAAIFVKPLRVTSANDELEAYIAETTTTIGPIGPCQQLAVAENLLAESADDEALGAGVLTHGVAIVGNAAIFLFLGIGFKHWGGGLLNGLGGLAISEAEIFMQPTGAVRALEHYNLGDVQAPASKVTWRLVPKLEMSGAGVTFVASF